MGPLLLFLVLIASQRSQGNSQINKVADLGDVNIGILQPVHLLNGLGQCGQVPSISLFSLTQVVRLTVDAINADPSILPNLRLGYLLMDTCQSRRKAMRYAVREVRPLWSPSDHRVPVFGMIGCQRSEPSISTSSYLQIFNMSLLSTTSTAVELSSTTRHPFFLRLVPNSKQMGRTIASLLLHFQWQYVTLIFESTASNQDIVRGLDAALEAASVERNATICFAVRQAILPDGEVSTYRRLVSRTLDSMGHSQVVLLFASYSHTSQIIREFSAQLTERRGRHNETTRADERLTFVFGDSYRPKFDRYFREIVDGAFVSNLFPYRSRWSEVVGTMTFTNISDSPWAVDFMAKKFRCSWYPKSQKPSCLNFTSVPFKDAGKYGGWTSYRHFSDFFLESAVHTYARSLDSLIRQFCPEVFSMSDESLQRALRRCVTGDRMHTHLLRVNFSLPDAEGRHVYTFFDSQGDVLSSNLTIEQMQTEHRGLRTIGTFSVKAGELTVNSSMLRWPAPLTAATISHCSYECNVGSATMRIDQCCWTCHQCEVNQIVRNSDDDASACKACPNLHWPNATSRASCHAIQPSPIPQSMVFGSICFGSVGVIMCVVIFVFMLRYQAAKLIRATSLPISLFLLTCIMLLFVETFLVVMAPSDSLCLFRQFAFPLIYTALYSTLLARTLRIFLIFRASDRLQRPQHLVDNRSQVVLITTLIAVQSLLLMGLVFSHEMSHVDREMPNPLKPYIHVVCRSTDLCLHLPTLYNTVLILICACLGFVTRRLPDNFRETMCLFICACSTLLLWACFFPVYSSISSFVSRSLLQLLILHLSAHVYLFSLFIPKVYAVCVQVRQNNESGVSKKRKFKSILRSPIELHREHGRHSLSAAHEKRLRRTEGGKSSTVIENDFDASTTHFASERLKHGKNRTSEAVDL